MSTPVLTVSALAALTLFMAVSLFTSAGTAVNAQPQVAAVAAAPFNG